ncbi:MAG: ribosome biogenesis GTP-binding protein YihA/YsxC [Patescibacteria group bacterium]
MSNNVTFEKSYSEIDQLPNMNRPEFAFIGRSNVGKSSLINFLAGQNNLARVSNTPGKTRTFNFYLVGASWHMVDLPGYGYAKVSKERRAKWDQVLVEYLLQREQLKQLFVLVDGSISVQKIDLEFIAFLVENEIEFSIVMTKTDKAKQSQVHTFHKQLETELKQLGVSEVNILQTSVNKKIGKSELLGFISKLMSK